jgi:hypothetical protein
MRIVVATTVDDPLAAVFWNAYHAAGGPAPAAIFFIAPRRQPRVVRHLTEALLLFGPIVFARTCAGGGRLRETLLTEPGRVFPGTGQFHYWSTLNKGDGLANLRASRADLLVSLGAPEIFKPLVLATAAVGAVNVHNGRLPRYRGVFGTFWEMYCGEEWGCATLHVMEPKVDAGAVLAQGVVRLTGRSLHDVLIEKKRAGGRLLAWLARVIEAERRYPAPCPHNRGVVPGYFGWPTLGQIAALRLRRLRRARPRESRAVAVWPPEWRADAPAPYPSR